MNLNTQIDEINQIFYKLNEEKKELINRISYYDTMVSEFYHLFENTKLPAHIRAQLDKKFDNCLAERRRYKMEYAKIISIDSLIKKKGLNSIVNKNKAGNAPFKPTILIDEFKLCSKYFKPEKVVL